MSASAFFTLLLLAMAGIALVRAWTNNDEPAREEYKRPKRGCRSLRDWLNDDTPACAGEPTPYKSTIPPSDDTHKDKADILSGIWGLLELIFIWWR